MGSVAPVALNFTAPFVITLPNGSKVAIPAGSTAVEVTAKKAADDAAALSWARNDAENDQRRVEALIDHEFRKARRLIEQLRSALASGSTALIAGGYADAIAWLTAHDRDPAGEALPTPTGWDPVGGRPTYGEPRGILSTVEGATREPQGLTAEAVWPLPGVRHPVEDDGA